MIKTLRKLNALDFSTLMRKTTLLENLDSLRLVTTGEPIGLMGMASSLFAQRHTGFVLEAQGKPLAMARAIQWQEEDFAQLQFICAKDPAKTNLSALIEALLQETGHWGLIKVMGDLPVSSAYLPDFRKANFIVWASHRCYRFSTSAADAPKKTAWRAWSAKDIDGIKAVYQTLVPARIRGYEPMTRSKVLGKVLSNEDGQIVAYADLDYGAKGLWAQIFALPEATHPETLEDLAKNLLAEYGRPVTFSARSYMPWLRAALDGLDLLAGEERALIARHLAVKDQLPEPVTDKIFEKKPAESGVYTIQSQH